MTIRLRHMTALIRGDPEVIVSIGPYLVLGSMAAIALTAHLDGEGIITAGFVMCLGAAGAGLSAWRTERGLWMFAALLLLMYGAIYVVMCIEQIRDALRGAPPLETSLFIDFLVGTVVLAATLRFLVRVAIANYSNKFDEVAWNADE